MAEQLNTPTIYIQLGTPVIHLVDVSGNVLESCKVTSPHGREDECARFIISDVEDAYGLRNTMTIGTEYTLSFWLKSDVSGYVRTSGEGTFKASSEWQKCVVTFDAESEDLVLSFDTVGTYYIYHIQLELGNVATDYRPATEDVDEDIYAAQIAANNAQAKADKNAEDMAAAVTEFNADIEGLQNQIDAHVMVWYGEVAPTVSNAPAKDWKDTDTKALHTGDMYYDTKTGYAYRWNLVSGAYAWTKIEDQDVVQALADSAKAQATADGKRRVFINTPVPPYDEGDLWLNDGNLYSCVKAKTEGAKYEEADFEKAVRYIGAEELDEWIKGDYTDDLKYIREQIDGKAETWYQEEDPSLDWTTDKLKAAHAGDLWYDTVNNKSFIYVFSQPDTTNPNPKEPADGQLAAPYITITSYGWQESDGVPQDVYDKIDKKAQIFSSKPTVPYYEKDLWVEGDKGDIKVCKTTRKEGSFSADDWVLASKYTDDSSLETFINDTYDQEIPALKTQVDGKAETWCQTTDPSLAWTDNDTKKKHLKDLWYNPETKTTKMYQYDSGTTTYSWVETVNVPAMFDRIDGKIQFFATQPTVPYYVNDLWVQGEKGDIYVCIEDSDDVFQAYHWVLASKYTDDTSLKTFMEGKYLEDLEAIGDQIDAKAETWYQTTDPSLEWKNEATRQLHVGDLWHNPNTNESYIYTSSGASSKTSTPVDGKLAAPSIALYTWVPSYEIPQAVFDSIDGKAQIFMAKPTSGYRRGDLYVEGPSIEKDANGNYVSGGNIYRCKNDYKAETASFANDWELASDYCTKTYTDAEIKKTNDEISLRVRKTDKDGCYVINEINLNESTAKIKAENIDLVGKVTISDFDTEAKRTLDSAAETATNFLRFDPESDEGLIVGDMTGDGLGNNVQIKGDAVNIRNKDAVLASFDANEIHLGKESKESKIHLCGDVGKISVEKSKDEEYGEDTLQISSGSVTLDGKNMVELRSDAEQAFSRVAVLSEDTTFNDYGDAVGGNGAVTIQTYKSGSQSGSSIYLGVQEELSEIKENMIELESKDFLSSKTTTLTITPEQMNLEGSFNINGALKYNNEAVSLVKFDKGYVLASSVPKEGYKDIEVNFNKAFSSTPRINLTLASSSTDGGGIGYITPTILANSESQTGFTIRIFNAGTTSRSPGVYWTAMEELT